MNSYAAPKSPTSPRPTRERPRIAVVGYGEGEGREHARLLRDRGHEVIVAMLPGGLSWIHAVKDGFRPLRTTEAVAAADVIVLVVPDDEQDLVFWEEVAPLARAGALLVLTRPIDLAAGLLPHGVNVAVITANEDGCLVSVRQDATTEARDRALAYLQWLGSEVPHAASSRMRVREASDPFPHPSRRVL